MMSSDQSPARPELMVVEDVEGCRFELRRGDEVVSHASYQRRGTTLVVPHVETHPAHRGRGHAAMLMDGLLDIIRGDERTIEPLCWFAAGHIRENPEYQDLLAGG